MHKLLGLIALSVVALGFAPIGARAGPVSLYFEAEPTTIAFVDEVSGLPTPSELQLPRIWGCFDINFDRDYVDNPVTGWYSIDSGIIAFGNFQDMVGPNTGGRYGPANHLTTSALADGTNGVAISVRMAGDNVYTVPEGAFWLGNSVMSLGFALSGRPELDLVNSDPSSHGIGFAGGSVSFALGRVGNGPSANVTARLLYFGATPPSQVPEPNSLLLAALGAVGLLIARHRRVSWHRLGRQLPQ